MQALRNGEADVVVAGGVNALITPMVTLGFDEIGAVLAPDGRIKSFSADADGYTRPKAAACWCSSGSTTPAATATRSWP